MWTSYHSSQWTAAGQRRCHREQTPWRRHRDQAEWTLSNTDYEERPAASHHQHPSPQYLFQQNKHTHSADWLFHAPEQTTATAALLSEDLGCGTVFLLNFVHQTSCWRRSETDWRHSCSICNCYPANLQLFPTLRYINILNNNNNFLDDVNSPSLHCGTPAECSRLSVRYQTFKHNILKTSEPILMPSATYYTGLEADTAT